MLWQMIGKLDPQCHRKWPVHQGSVLIAYNATRSLVTGFPPYYLIFGQRTRLLIDLLFQTHWEYNLTCTIDKYVKTQHLWKSVKIAQDSALKEALWQKQLYDHKVGAIELQPRDCALVKLDAFQGQQWKLKNRWGSDLYTMVTWVADGVPTYVVKNEDIGKKKVLHHPRLLLWLANFGKPVQINHMCTRVSHLGQILENSLFDGDDGSPVLGSVQCGLNLAKLWIIVDTPESMICGKCIWARFGMGPA